MVITGISPAGLYGNGRVVLAAEAGDVASGSAITISSAASGSAAGTTGPAIDETLSSQGSLRLIFTTDIHGQVVNYDYQTGKNLTRGLNKAYTLIQAARNEVNPSNYFTFDVGDSVMDFNTDYIYSQDSESLQPVYNAMTMINYDAITLGNHDFDFGYDYIVNQLEMSGLMEKCVLSNVYSGINGDSVFGVENKIIEKQIKSDAGTDMTVKVGIIGETTPALSSRTEGYKNKLATEDIIENAQKQADTLKEQGADIIVALAHSGFGTETPSKKSSDAAYALTKIDSIDVVLAGHEHIDFPAKNKDDVHYTLPGVDKNTGLVNGKRLVMVRDSCRGIGVIDLDLKPGEDGKIAVSSSSYEIRNVKAETEASADITNTMAGWDAMLKEYCQKEIGNLAEGESWDNYFAPLDNNEIMQTVHNAQIKYASNYIVNNAPEYKDYPIVSITRYTKYGSDSGADYSDLSGTIVEGNADSFANYHRYVYIYQITGGQLKEWMEWSASIYQTTGTSADDNWNNILLSDYVKKENGDSLLQEEFISAWNRFFQFEGVEYKVDPSAAPRYNFDGTKINNSNRIKDVTRNGVPVGDEDRFILVTDKIVPGIQSEANAHVASQVVSKSHVILQDIVLEYLADKALLGNLQITVSHNWELLLPENYKYIFVSGTGSETKALKQDWCEGIYGSIAEANYYKCVNKPKGGTDTDAPGVVLSPDNTSETNTSVNISVIANDKSGIKTMKYAYGIFSSKDDEIWKNIAGSAVATGTVTSGSAVSGGAIGTTDTAAGDTAENTSKIIERGSFEITKSGVYSVYVEDGAGNVTIEKIAVANINPEILLKPVANKFDNNDTKLTGNAEPNLYIYVEAGLNSYEGKVGIDGSFSVKIPPQKAKKKLSVYVEDNNGRQSKKTTVVVKRAGPNCPTITSAKNNDTKIAGKTNDTNVKIYAVIGERVYVSKSLGSSYYTKCKKYNEDLTIKKVNITIKENGSYSVTIPNQYANTAVKVFAVDKLGRVSHARSKKITKAAPNRVTLYDVYDIERYVYGRVPGGKKCTVVVKTPEKAYKAVADEEGYFTASVGVLEAGSEIKVHAYKRKADGTAKKGYAKTYTVESAEEMYPDLREVTIHIDEVTDKDKKISGKWTADNEKIYICADNMEYVTTTDDDGKYSVDIKSRLSIGTPVYVLSRNTKSKGGITGMRRFKVILGAPAAPVITSQVTTDTRYVEVYTKEECTVILKTGSKKYTSTDGAYNRELNRYYYTFRITGARQGASVQAYARNEAGTTQSKVKQVKPGQQEKSNKTKKK